MLLRCKCCGIVMLLVVVDCVGYGVVVFVVVTVVLMV